MNEQETIAVTTDIEQPSSEQTRVERLVSHACQSCGGASGVETISIFGHAFRVCAYCRHDALETLEMSYTWERDDGIGDDESCSHGCAVVFDGRKEIYRRGFGLKDHG